MSEFDFTRGKPPTPPPAANEPQAGIPSGEGVPPFKPGAVITDWTKTQLQELGWQDGDPVPGEITEIINEAKGYIREKTQEEIANLAADARAKGVKPTVNVDDPNFLVRLEDLPLEKQAEIKSAMDRARQQYAAMEQQRDEAAQYQVPGAGPGVQNAINTALDATKKQPERQPTVLEQQQQGGAFKLEDDLDEAVEQYRQEIRQDQKPAGNAAAKEPATEKAAPAQPAGDTAAGTCPKCGWDASLPYEVEVTDAAKNGWAVSLIGRKRFNWEVSLLGGRIQVVFRTLTAREGNMILQQLGNDQDAGELRNAQMLLERMQEYRYAMGTHVVYYDGVPAGPPLPDNIDDVKVDGGITAVRAITDRMNNKIVTDESLRRAVAAKYQQFQRLVEKLEVLADDPDFFGGTPQGH